MRRIKTHHIVGGLCVLQGWSFITETYTIATRALATPLSLLNWVPGVSGQTAWGYAFLIIGISILVSFNMIMRAIALALGTMAWGIFTVASLYESLFGSGKDTAGSLLGLLGLTVVVSFLRASAQVLIDFHPHHPQHGRPTHES